MRLKLVEQNAANDSLHNELHTMLLQIHTTQLQLHQGRNAVSSDDIKATLACSTYVTVSASLLSQWAILMLFIDHDICLLALVVLCVLGVELLIYLVFFVVMLIVMCWLM